MSYEAIPSRKFVGAGAVLIALVIAWLWFSSAPERMRKTALGMTLPAASVAPAPSAEQALPAKPVYRNSVIPGGVHSAADLAAAIARDPVIRAHYANFNVATTRVVRLEQARMVHVSYRIGDTIYWTKKKVQLAQGELLLSDGTHLARTRCGNRIADEPQGPVLDNEPAPEELDALVVSADDIGDQPAGIASVAVATDDLFEGNEPQGTGQGGSNLQYAGLAPVAVFPNLLTRAQLGPLQDTSFSGLPGVALTAPGALNDVKDGSGPKTPGTPTSDPKKPTIETPDPKKPTTETPDPKKPTTETPDPKKPTTETPDPKKPTTETPDPKKPEVTGPPYDPPHIPAPAPTPHPALLVPDTPRPVPEPGSAALVGIALAALALGRRRVARTRLN
jgi:hypothetical protein